MNVFLNKRRSILPKILIGIVILFVFIGILNLFQKELKNLFYFISSPSQKVFWKIGNNISNFFELFLKLKSLKKENEELINENQKLLAEISSLQEVKRENQALKEIISNNQLKELKLVLTDVISLDNYQDFILIDKGEDNGISENMPVINSQKVLFGKVFKVYKNFSKVMLISNKDSVLDVKIQSDNSTQTPIYGAIKGKGNLAVYLDLIPAESEIKEGDILVTSALEGTFPKGLLVGKITEVRKEDLKPFQTAKVEPFFDIKKTDKLFVITDYKKIQ
jgi:rod shape-determining protein MreC